MDIFFRLGQFALLRCEHPSGPILSNTNIDDILYLVISIVDWAIVLYSDGNILLNQYY